MNNNHQLIDVDEIERAHAANAAEWAEAEARRRKEDERIARLAGRERKRRAAQRRHKGEANQLSSTASTSHTHPASTSPSTQEISAMPARPDLTKMSNEELLSYFNRISGEKPVKRFSSRTVAIKRITALYTKQPSKPKARTVKGSAGSVAGSAGGRPRGTFTLKLTESSALSTPQSNSLRAQVIALLRAAPSNTMTLDALENKMGRRLTGVMQKLHVAKWVDVKRTEPSAP